MRGASGHDRSSQKFLVDIRRRRQAPRHFARPRDRPSRVADSSGAAPLRRVFAWHRAAGMSGRARLHSRRLGTHERSAEAPPERRSRHSAKRRTRVATAAWRRHRASPAASGKSAGGSTVSQTRTQRRRRITAAARTRAKTAAAADAAAAQARAAVAFRPRQERRARELSISATWTGRLARFSIHRYVLSAISAG